MLTPQETGATEDESRARQSGRVVGDKRVERSGITERGMDGRRRWLVRRRPAPPCVRPHPNAAAAVSSVDQSAIEDEGGTRVATRSGSDPCQSIQTLIDHERKFMIRR